MRRGRRGPADRIWQIANAPACAAPHRISSTKAGDGSGRTCTAIAAVALYRESAGNEIWEALDSESDIADAIASDAIRFLTPIDQLAVYRWGTGTGADYFCPTCGVMPFRKPSVPTPEEAEAVVARFEGGGASTQDASTI